MPIPHELSVGGIYLPPLLVAAVLGAAAALLTARLLDRYRLSRFFASAPLALIGMCVLYTVFIGTFFIGI